LASRQPFQRVIACYRTPYGVQTAGVPLEFTFNIFRQSQISRRSAFLSSIKIQERQLAF